MESSELFIGHVPSMRELQTLLEIKQEQQCQAAKEAMQHGFVFDPIVGYVPWGPGGPALESQSWS